MNNNKQIGQNYVKYIGLVTQMALIILIFSYGGYFISKKVDLEKSYLTAGFSLLGVFVGLFVFFKQLPKE